MDTEEIRQLKEILVGGNSASVQIDPVLTEIRDLLLTQANSSEKKHWVDYLSGVSGMLLVLVTILSIGAKAYITLKSDLETVAHSQNSIKRELSVQANNIASCEKKHEIIDRFLIEYNIKEKLSQGGAILVSDASVIRYLVDQVDV